jgi:hypothetical protein
MTARLTRIEAKRRGDVIALGLEEMRVGRDPDSDLVIEGVRGSRLHAMIRPLADRHTLTDSGSTNGTTVNGVALARAPVLLEGGDLIEFAGQFAYLYETGPAVSTQSWLLTACVMVALLLVSGGVAFWQLVLYQPILEQATELAREGRDAGERGELAIANARLTEAARLLIRNGYLDDVERSELMPAAMDRLETELENENDLLELLNQVQQAQRAERDAVINELATQAQPSLDPAAAAPAQLGAAEPAARGAPAPAASTQEAGGAGSGHGP